MTRCWGSLGCCVQGSPTADGHSSSRQDTSAATPAGQALASGFLKGVEGPERVLAQQRPQAGQTQPQWLRERERGPGRDWTPGQHFGRAAPPALWPLERKLGEVGRTPRAHPGHSHDLEALVSGQAYPESPPPGSLPIQGWPQPRPSRILRAEPGSVPSQGPASLSEPLVAPRREKWVPGLQVRGH